MTHKEPYLQFLWRDLVTRYMIKHNPIFGKNRRMAVWANDWVGANIYINGVYEKPELDMLMRLVDSRLTVLDIGANVGNHSIYFSDKFLRVWAFEPNPETYRLLTFNVTYPVYPYNYAIGDYNGETNLWMHDEPGMCSGTRNTGKGIRVEMRKLDSFKFDTVSLIKIDVEGMEYEVLKGAERTIRRYSPVIAFEQSAEDIKNRRCLDLLKDWGYKFYWIETTDRRKMNPVVRVVRTLYELFAGRKTEYTLREGEPPVMFHTFVIAKRIKQ